MLINIFYPLCLSDGLNSCRLQFDCFLGVIVAEENIDACHWEEIGSVSDMPDCERSSAIHSADAELIEVQEAEEVHSSAADVPVRSRTAHRSVTENEEHGSKDFAMRKNVSSPDPTHVRSQHGYFRCQQCGSEVCGPNGSFPRNCLLIFQQHT